MKAWAGDKNVPPTRLCLTGRGRALAVAAVALVAAGVLAGLLALTATGAALLLACATGLAEVLLARRFGGRGPVTAPEVAQPRARRFSPFDEPERATSSWVRLDQHGSVVARVGAPPQERGLYQRRSITLSWRDMAGFWQGSRTVPVNREAYVPPAANASLVRFVVSQLPHHVFEAAATEPAASVRAYEKGDPLRQIAWRQTAHHGQLMSFDTEATRMPPVLVVVDTLDCPDANAVAATAAALLHALKASPDVLLTDGVGTYRTPAQQDRFLAALLADSESHGSLAERSHLVSRLAAQARRSVLVVACGSGSRVASSLSCPARVVSATGPAVAAALREHPAEKTTAPEDAPPPARSAPHDASTGVELVASLLAVACAPLCLPALHGSLHEGAWPVPVAAFLASGIAGGCLVGMWARRKGTRRSAAARVGALALVSAAVVVTGLLAVNALFEARWGFSLLESTAGLTRGVRAAVSSTAQGPDPLGALVALVARGVGQLAGTVEIPDSGLGTAWDLVVILTASVGTPVAAAVASSRAARPALALLPVGLAAAEQVIMNNPPELAPLAAALACGIMLLWLAHARRMHLVRLACVVLLASACAAAGTGLAHALAPGRSGGLDRWGTMDGGTSINTLVDLSRDLRRNSNDVALTYTTDADQPVYLAFSMLENFDGSTWEFSRSARSAMTDSTPLRRLLTRSSLDSSVLGSTVHTRLTPADSSEELPIPPGTMSVEELDGGSISASGTYVEPLTSTDDIARLEDLVTKVSSAVPSFSSDYEMRELPGPTDATEIPTLISTIQQAHQEGASATNGDTASQIAAVRWIISHFTQGDFTYSLSAPDGGGTNNLEVINDFLKSKRGYCVHYASAVAVLARELNLSSRIVLGYAPTREFDGLYVVRMTQLHAWAEVKIDAVGWVGIDVTPAAEVGSDDVEPEVVGTAQAPSRDPEPTEPDDTPEESTPGESGQDETPESPSPDPASEKNPQPAVAWAPVALGALCAVAVGGCGVAVACWVRRRRYDVARAWLDLCRAARRGGVHWEPSATEEQVCELICTALSSKHAAQVRELCRDACLVRYGGSMAAHDPRVLLASVSELRREL